MPTLPTTSLALGGRLTLTGQILMQVEFKETPAKP